MTNLLIAALALTQAQAAPAWELKAPFKDNDTTRYSVVISITDAGQEISVDMIMQSKISKKSESGFEGTFGWTQLYVGGEQQPDETFDIKLKPNGVLKSVGSNYGDGMRRMFVPFFLVYPDKAVAKDATWTYKDASEDELDAHKANLEYKVVGNEKVKDKDAVKIEMKMSEQGPSPMKATGYFWVGMDGKILKYELDLKSWPVPVAGSVFDAKVKAELTG